MNDERMATPRISVRSFHIHHSSFIVHHSRKGGIAVVPILLFLIQQTSTTPAGGGALQAALTKGVPDFILLSFLLFSIGVAGVLMRRNILIIFMSVELILNAANLNFVTFTRYWQTMGRISEHMGHLFTIFIIVVAAAEAVVGLGIVIALYRNRHTVAIDEIDLLKW
jgi:NADH-quinone oxidoreductase subunit K